MLQFICVKHTQACVKRSIYTNFVLNFKLHKFLFKFYYTEDEHRILHKFFCKTTILYKSYAQFFHDVIHLQVIYTNFCVNNRHIIF